ncbi:ABC transporter permease [Microtetraspora malaysiensis]|uniref:ABC transporter permease n=1 Tax=Microtetraspora malaysiensis TaxID=161358 RepID=A0ABW6T1R2_9ACTN
MSVLRRFGRLALSLFVLVSAAFAMLHLVPGDPVRAALGDDAPAALVEARRHELWLDRPLWEQYTHYLHRLITGDLGTSMVSGLPVGDVIGARFPATATLAALSLAVVLLVSVPTGMAMAALTRGERHRAAELTFTGVTGALSLIPEFLLAVGLVAVMSVGLGWLPVAGMSGPASYLLPVLALACGPAAALSRIVRVESLKVFGQDYIRTARSKRLPRRLIYLRHALPNLLTAALTIGGLLAGGLIAGTVLVETVFAWPGLGSTIVQSIQGKDYPLVQGIVLVYGGIVLVVNLGVDLLLGVLDPRSMIRES